MPQSDQDAPQHTTEEGHVQDSQLEVPQTLQYTTEVDVHNSAQQLSQTQQNTIEGQVDNGVFTDITNDVTNLETDNTADITNLETDLQVLNQTDLEQLSTDLQLDVLGNGGTNVGLKDSFYIVNSNEKGDRFLIPVRVQNEFYNLLGNVVDQSSIIVDGSNITNQQTGSVPQPDKDAQQTQEGQLELPQKCNETSEQKAGNESNDQKEGNETEEHNEINISANVQEHSYHMTENLTQTPGNDSKAQQNEVIGAEVSDSKKFQEGQLELPQKCNETSEQKAGNESNDQKEGNETEEHNEINISANVQEHSYHMTENLTQTPGNDSKAQQNEVIGAEVSDSKKCNEHKEDNETEEHNDTNTLVVSAPVQEHSYFPHMTEDLTQTPGNDSKGQQNEVIGAEVEDSETMDQHNKTAQDEGIQEEETSEHNNEATNVDTTKQCDMYQETVVNVMDEHNNGVRKEIVVEVCVQEIIKTDEERINDSSHFVKGKPNVEISEEKPEQESTDENNIHAVDNEIDAREDTANEVSQGAGETTAKKETIIDDELEGQETKVMSFEPTKNEGRDQCHETDRRNETDNGGTSSHDKNPKTGQDQVIDCIKAEGTTETHDNKIETKLEPTTSPCDISKPKHFYKSTTKAVPKLQEQELTKPRRAKRSDRVKNEISPDTSRIYPTRTSITILDRPTRKRNETRGQYLCRLSVWMQNRPDSSMSDFSYEDSTTSSDEGDDESAIEESVRYVVIYISVTVFNVI